MNNRFCIQVTGYFMVVLCDSASPQCGCMENMEETELGTSCRILCPSLG